MIRCRLVAFVMLAWLTAALGLYELTAKSPRLTGSALPGWWATEKAERATRWRPPTGLLPIDKLLHEAEEAARFWATLARSRSAHRAQAR